MTRRRFRASSVSGRASRGYSDGLGAVAVVPLVVLLLTIAPVQASWLSAGEQAARLEISDLPLGLPDDVGAAATILYAEDRRELTADLTRLSRVTDAEIRGRAALAIARVGLPIASTRLIELLRDGDPRVRALAAFGLGVLELDLEPALRLATARRITEQLLRVLGDAEPVVVQQALWSLGRLADPLALAAVRKVLLTAELPRATYQAALTALWRLPGASPQDAAPHLGSEDAKVRLAAASSMRFMEDPDAMPPLAEALTDVDPQVRAEAIRGLGGAPPRVAGEHLLTLLADEEWLVLCAALAWVAELWDDDADLDDAVFTAVLRASADRNRHVQRLAFAALAAAPSKFSVPEDRLIFAVRNGGPAIRLAALDALAVGDVSGDALAEVREVYGIDAPPADVGATVIPDSLAQSPLEAAAVVRVLARADERDQGGWFSILTEYGPAPARAEGLRQIASFDPEEASLLADRMLADDAAPLQAVAGEVIARLDVSGQLRGRGEGRETWSDVLWAAQRELGPTAQLDPRLTLLDALLSLDAEMMRRRAVALITDPDRSIRLWAFRNLQPAGGLFAAEATADALAPVATGRSRGAYDGLARRLIALQKNPPLLEIQTSRGLIVWQLRVDWAPLAGLAYLDWVDSGFFDDMRFHRVSAGFTIQAGDASATGYGVAAGSLRNEETPIPFAPATVGLALAGRDTGASRFFVTVTAQPHLTGIYPLLGTIVEGARIVGRVQPGDTLSIGRR